MRNGLDFDVQRSEHGESDYSQEIFETHGVGRYEACLQIFIRNCVELVDLLEQLKPGNVAKALSFQRTHDAPKHEH